MNDNASVPAWATCVVRNYRLAYAARFGSDPALSDAAIFRIERDAPVMGSHEEQDELVLDLMREALPAA